jgi:hypothetical protein
MSLKIIILLFLRSSSIVIAFLLQVRFNFQVNLNFIKWELNVRGMRWKQDLDFNLIPLHEFPGPLRLVGL